MFQTLSLLLLISLGYFATDVYLPSLPAIADDFGVDDSLVQLTLFTYLISFAATPLLFGPLSDQFGRKKVIQTGLILLLFGTIGCYFSPGIYWLIGFRAVQGAGSGAIIISSRAMIPDLYTGVKLAKKITHITMFMPVALALAPSIGGYMQQHYGWRSVFLFLSFYVILILLKMRLVDESLKVFSERKWRHAMRSYQALVSDRKFVLISLGMVFPAIGIFAYLSSSAFLFQEVFGMTPFEYGALSMYIGAAVMIASFINSRLLSSLPVNVLLWAGTVMMGISGVVLITFHFFGLVTVWSALAPVLLYFMCLPFCISNSISKAMTTINSSYGAAGALMTATQFFAGSLGTLVFSLFPHDSLLPLGACFLLVSLSTGVVLRAGRFLKC
jgi:MFS transporter, DHA1 family, 2-module integral membrane pump EmrD